MCRYMSITLCFTLTWRANARIVFFIRRKINEKFRYFMHMQVFFIFKTFVKFALLGGLYVLFSVYTQP